MSLRPSTDSAERATHWDSIYSSTADSGVSWYQAEPRMSLDLIDALGIASDDGVIDVGGGASMLVDNLLARGFTDIGVLDVSEAALAVARGRLGEATGVQWLAQDLLTWQPTRRYRLWHDRAVFHFLVDATDQARYLRVLRDALDPGGAVILGAFAPEAPDRCSGLRVVRRDTRQLTDVLEGFTVVDARTEEHSTPRGVRQPFSWVAARAGR